MIILKTGLNISRSFISHGSSQYQLRFFSWCIPYCSPCMQTTQLSAAVLPCQSGAWLDQTVSPADLRGRVTECCFNVRHWHTVLWRQRTEHTDKRLQIRAHVLLFLLHQKWLQICLCCFLAPSSCVRLSLFGRLVTASDCEISCSVEVRGTEEPSGQRVDFQLSVNQWSFSFFCCCLHFLLAGIFFTVLKFISPWNYLILWFITIKNILI